MRLIGVLVLGLLLGCDGGGDPAGPGGGGSGGDTAGGGAAGAGAGGAGASAGSGAGTAGAESGSSGGSGAGALGGSGGSSGGGGAGTSGTAGASVAGTSGSGGTAGASYPTCPRPFKGDDSLCTGSSGVLRKAGMICALCSTVPGGQTGMPTNCVVPSDGMGAGGDLCVSDCHVCS